MDIILEWDPSVASLRSSERAAFEAAVTYAADYWDYTILNPVTIDLSVGWGEITQDGQSTPIPSGESEGGPNDGYIYNYGQVVSALRSSATSAAGISAAANLSAIDPSGGTGIYISALHAEALGLPSYTDGAVAAGAVGFGAPDPGSPYNFSTTNRAIPGEADLVGKALHEISHALDRVSDAGSSEPPTIADLFRFTAPGVENPSAGLNSYFSVDGGNTPLEYWAGPSTDPGDWSTTSGPDSYIDDSFNDMYAVGVENPVTSVDLNLMSALGYAIAPPPDDDFTGQGLADITWRNTDGDTGLWLTNPGGGYTPVDIGSADASWSIQATGDFNGDGKADILWRNTNGELGEWLSNSGSPYNGMTAVDLGMVPTSWVIQGVGDFDGNGLADILWRNVNGDAGLWLTTSGGGHSVVDFGVIDPGWSIQGVGDFNGDGKADILWRNASGQVGEWLSNAGAGYAGFTPVELANVSSDWSIQDVADFNGDGLSDILWHNSNGDTGVWFTGAGGGYSVVDFGLVDTSWSIQGVGDFNGDGKADILWRNADGQVGEWLSNSGTGYTGFTAVILGTPSQGWQIAASGSSNLGAAVTSFTQAMAAMASASTSGMDYRNVPEPAMSPVLAVHPRAIA